MTKRTIKYTDFNGVEREEDFYFNLSEAELLELQITTTGGFADELKKVIALQDQPAIAKLLKKLILDSYGEKSADGRRFIKTPELSAEFSQMPAFGIMYTDLMYDDVKAAAFINGIIPAELANKPEFKQAMAEQALALSPATITPFEQPVQAPAYNQIVEQTSSPIDQTYGAPHAAAPVAPWQAPQN